MKGVSFNFHLTNLERGATCTSGQSLDATSFSETSRSGQTQYRFVDAPIFFFLFFCPWLATTSPRLSVIDNDRVIIRCIAAWRGGVFSAWIQRRPAGAGGIVWAWRSPRPRGEQAPLARLPRRFCRPGPTLLISDDDGVLTIQQASTTAFPVVLRHQ